MSSVASASPAAASLAPRTGSILTDWKHYSDVATDWTEVDKLEEQENRKRKIKGKTFFFSFSEKK